MIPQADELFGQIAAAEAQIESLRAAVPDMVRQVFDATPKEHWEAIAAALYWGYPDLPSQYIADIVTDGNLHLLRKKIPPVPSEIPCIGCGPAAHLQ